MPDLAAHSIATELRQAIAELSAVIEATRHHLGNDQQFRELGIAPEQVLDTNGRPVLADMLTARANALAALASLRVDDGHDPAHDH